MRFALLLALLALSDGGDQDGKATSPRGSRDRADRNADRSPESLSRGEHPPDRASTGSDDADADAMALDDLPPWESGNDAVRVVTPEPDMSMPQMAEDDDAPWLANEDADLGGSDAAERMAEDDTEPWLNGDDEFDTDSEDEDPDE